MSSGSPLQQLSELGDFAASADIFKATRSAGSPITSAASAFSSMAVGSGAAFTYSGVICQRRFERIFTSATVLRELVSSANVRAKIGRASCRERVEVSWG